MPAKPYVRPTVSAMPTTPPLLAPQPPIAPLTPPVHVVDLMTPEGSAVFGALWRGIEAKLVECPALSDSRPEFPTTTSSRMPSCWATTTRPGRWCRPTISAVGAAVA